MGPGERERRMFKKVIAAAIGIVMALLVTMSITEAATGTISGTSIKQCVCFSATGAIVSCSGTFAVKRCSIDIASILKGLGNVGNGPNAVAAAYDVHLFVQNGTLFCVNKPGNAEPASGTPFEATVIDQVDVISNKEIDKNGKALSDLFFTDKNILDALGISIADLCPNKNWTGYVLVQDLQALGRLFRDPDLTDTTLCNLDPQKGALVLDGCILADALGVTCSAPDGATVTAPFEYTCDVACQNSAGNVCPTGTPEDPFFPLPSNP
jgi:hypothetical protein